MNVTFLQFVGSSVTADIVFKYTLSPSIPDSSTRTPLIANLILFLSFFIVGLISSSLSLQIVISTLASIFSFSHESSSAMKTG